jgi:hypothetical protein
MPTLIAADIDRRVKVIDGEGKDNRTVERVSDLRSMPFVVLLGEPGIGKSTVLAREALTEGASEQGCQGVDGRQKAVRILKIPDFHTVSPRMFRPGRLEGASSV